MRFLFILILLVLNFPVLAQFDWIKSETKRLAPNEWRVLQMYESIPSKVIVNLQKSTVTVTKATGTFDYLLDGDKKKQLRSMSTNCHEINHGLTHIWAFMILNDTLRRKSISQLVNYKPLNPLYYFLLPNEKEFIATSGLKFFPSRELVSKIPGSQRTFRFETYIDGTSSTQSHGILALLDEYNSYLHGYSFHFQMKEAYISSGKSELDGYTNWRADLWSDRSAYWEFNHYILEYLLLAKEKYPQIYTEFKDGDWGKIYNAITENFWQLIKSHNHEIESSKLYWKTKGVVLTTRPGWEQFDGVSTSTSDTEIILKPVLLSKKYEQVRVDLGLVNCANMP